jgi:hypothetical protein
MNKFKKVAVLAALKGVQKNLDDEAFFSVCPIDKLGGALGVKMSDTSNLQTLHCIHFADMPPGFKIDIIEEINTVFGSALSEFGIVFENRIENHQE